MTKHSSKTPEKIKKITHKKPKDVLPGAAEVPSTPVNARSTYTTDTELTPTSKMMVALLNNLHIDTRPESTEITLFGAEARLIQEISKLYRSHCLNLSVLCLRVKYADLRSEHHQNNISYNLELIKTYLYELVKLSGQTLFRNIDKTHIIDNQDIENLMLFISKTERLEPDVHLFAIFLLGVFAEEPQFQTKIREMDGIQYLLSHLQLAENLTIKEAIAGAFAKLLSDDIRGQEIFRNCGAQKHLENLVEANPTNSNILYYGTKALQYARESLAQNKNLLFSVQTCSTAPSSSADERYASSSTSSL